MLSNGKNPLFDGSLIRRIIQNPVYCGKIAYGRRRTEKVHGTRNDYRQVYKDDYLLVDGLHEALVSEEVWEQAQIKVAAQAKNMNKRFAGMMREKINMEVDTSALDQEISAQEKTLRQSYLNKDAILSDLDNLDYEDKHYKRRKADLEDRLSKTYDKIEETENALVEAKAKKRSILAEKVCGDNIYKALIFFDKMYEPMNEAERREFLTQFIEKVEIYEEEQENGQWLKPIEFKLPIISKDMKISLDNGSQIEAVGLIMGIDSLCGMFRCMSNCLGDVAVTAIVAKSEGVLDMKKYAWMK